MCIYVFIQTRNIADDAVTGDNIADSTVKSSNIDWESMDYSATKRVIGKWSDGRNLCQVCYERKGSFTQSNWNNLGALTGTDMSKVIPLSVDGFARQTSDGNYVPIPRDTFMIYVDHNNGNWNFRPTAAVDELRMVIKFLESSK